MQTKIKLIKITAFLLALTAFVWASNDDYEMQQTAHSAWTK